MMIKLDVQVQTYAFFEGNIHLSLLFAIKVGRICVFNTSVTVCIRRDAFHVNS